MANSSTGNAANASKNLINQAQGFAGPGSPLYTGFQNSLGTAQTNQANLLSGATDNISNLQNLSATGGYDPTQLNQIEGGYSDLATTGGYTPQQSQQFMQQATEGTESTYGSLENQAKQASIATGGLGTGGGLSQMARQLSQAQGQNTLNAEVALNQSQTANKLSGLGGEANVAGSVASNKLQGTEAAGSQLNQLYNTTTGQVTALGNQMLATLGLDFQTQEQAANTLAKISSDPSMFQSLMGMIGGGISGIMTGGLTSGLKGITKGLGGAASGIGG
jgi:hypothetical protein